MNRIKGLTASVLFALSSLIGCSKKNTVNIFVSLEDERIQLFNKELKQRFPSYNIRLIYKTTGALMAELQAQGARTDADIFIGIEITNAEILLANNANLFADLSDYDTSCYIDDVLEYQKDVVLESGAIHKGHKKYHIQDKEAGCIVYSKSMLKAKNLNVPAYYEDLLNNDYSNSIIMPNPKSSGTGYYFYNGLASVYGKEKALTYFGNLDKNIKEWSSSGSGPVKGVDKKEITVGLGMHFQAVKYANDNDDIDITYFKEGSPYTLYTMGMINGKENNKIVKEVYDYIYNHVNYMDNSQMVPETIYKSEYAFSPALENWKYPSDYGVNYTMMKNLLDPAYKQDLLDSWKI